MDQDFLFSKYYSTLSLKTLTWGFFSGFGKLINLFYEILVGSLSG
jgi:hypothetical protein